MNLFVETTVSIYTILSPVIGAAIMIGMTPTATPDERIRISRQACLVAGSLLIVFAVAGNFIMETVFRISTHAFQVGGGMYLLTIAVGMVIAKEAKEAKEEKTGDSQGKPVQQVSGNIAITPIGTPLLTGPGTITATLVKKSSIPNNFSSMAVFFTAMIFVIFLSYLTFVISCKFANLLTPKVLGVIEKITGLILICIALESIIAGTSTFLRLL
ncbi:MAG: MarC family protein [Puniceicoccales bacterium]|jgi:multiple antibiotic resistance protein|nr:MarC family protein [Puniceicoccales bacterium]